MSEVTQRQPLRTLTWIDLGIPDLEMARDLHPARCSDWEFVDAGPDAGHYTFYAGSSSFSVDGNSDLPELDVTFLRRPDGPEVGGVVAGARSMWQTAFEVADTDAILERRVSTAVEPASRRTSGPGGWRRSPTRSAPSSR